MTGDFEDHDDYELDDGSVDNDGGCRGTCNPMCDWCLAAHACPEMCTDLGEECPYDALAEREAGITVLRCYELTSDCWLGVPHDGGLLIGSYESVGIGLRSQGMPDALDGPLACALIVEIGNALLADGLNPLDDASSWPPVPVNLEDMFARHAAGLPPLRPEAKPAPQSAPDPRQMVLL